MMMMILSQLIILISLLWCTSASAIETFINSTSQALVSGSLSYTTTFPSNQSGYLSTVSVAFSSAPASAETIKVILVPRTGTNYNVELARYVTIAGTTTTVAIVFQSSIPISAGDQIQVTCTNVSAATTAYSATVLDTAVRNGSGLSIYSNGALVVSSLQHRLLGNQHTDIVSAAVVRGDIITGQSATPAWTRLAVGSANKQLQSDGTDVVYSSWTQAAPTGDDYVNIADSTTATTWRLLPNCIDSVGQHLNYTLSSNAFSCGTSVPSSGAGSGDITTVGTCTTADCGIEGGTDIFPFIYEGTADLSETTFSVTNPTADRAIVFPNLGGTVALQTGAGFTLGSVPFIDANGNLAQDNATLFWDTTNKKLNLGLATSPTDFSSRFSVLTGATAGGGNYIRELAKNANTTDKGFLISAARGDTGAETTVANGDTLFNLYGQGYDGTNYITAAYLSMGVDTAVAAGDVRGSFLFITRNSAGLATRARILSDGSFGIGTSSPDGVLDVNGAIYHAEVTAPGTPAAGQGVLYAKSSDSSLYWLSDGGVEYPLNILVDKPSATHLAKPIILSTNCTLDGAATASCTAAVAYTSSTSYTCAAATTTNTNSIKVVRTSSTVVTVTSAVTMDTGVVLLVCVGN